MPASYIRARRPDGTECVIDLIELESALEGGAPGEYYFMPDSGEIVFHSTDDLLDDDDLEQDDEDEVADTPADALPLDPVDSRVRFRWMEDFIQTVHSITAKSALSHALRLKKPFRHFKDVLLEYPAVRERWFQFEAEKTKGEAIALIESFDWEILEVADARPQKSISDEVDPAERVPLTSEEYEWILRGAWEIAAKGGRTQLALLLKGSKNKTVMKHGLDQAPAYGKLSFLTIEEIENRIDHVIRKNDLRVEFFGDLPLIVLTDQGWEHVRPWANEHEARVAAAAGERLLNEILLKWRGRRRDEQLDLINAVASIDAENARRVLNAWREIAGKEVRAHIETKLQSL